MATASLLLSFVDVEFEKGQDLNILTPITSVSMGYIDDGSLHHVRWDCESDEAWKLVSATLIQAYNASSSRCNALTLVGYNLRNLVWPALAANLMRTGNPIPYSLKCDATHKWNNVPMIDLYNVLIQGGFSDKPISLEDACWFFGIHTEDEANIVKVYQLFNYMNDYIVVK
jgi:hypothetical protein